MEVFLSLIVAEMTRLKANEDFEGAHREADDLLCEALELLGQDELVEAFRDVGKYYA